MATAPIRPIRMTETLEWKALAEHHQQIGAVHLRELFSREPDRGTRLTVQAGDLYLDYSKNRLTEQTVRLLVALAEKAGLRERIEAMWSGEHINVTEDRAVLHVALRAPRTERITTSGRDVVPGVHAML